MMTSEDTRICPKCLNSTSATGRFCRHCGAEKAQGEAAEPRDALVGADRKKAPQNPVHVANSVRSSGSNNALGIVWILATLCCGLGFFMVLVGLFGLAGFSSDGDLASNLQGILSGILWMMSGLFISVTSYVLARAVTYLFRVSDDGRP